jgi:cell division transport system permease protein
MAFLASLAIAGWMGAAVLTRHWDSGAGATLTVQVPEPADPAASAATPDATSPPTSSPASSPGTRLAAVQAVLVAAPGVVSAKTLSDEELNALLRPWLGADIKTLAIPVPAVIAVQMAGEAKDPTGLAAQLSQVAPGTIVEDHAASAGRLGTLARSLRLCSGIVLLSVTMVTVAVIAVAARTGLAARREAVLIVHQLGATDGYIARRFASRVAVLAAMGGAIGGLLALPAVFILTTLAAPLAGQAVIAPTSPAALVLVPLPLWLLPVILAVVAAIIGYVTIQVTLRRWLRRLP